VVIYAPDGKVKLRFDTSNHTVLQGYTFGTSINDEKGKFSLTFYPDDNSILYKDTAIFDHIQAMDIVEIYESRNHFRQYRMGSGKGIVQKILPTFTGVVREKKFAGQMSNSGVSRRIVVSGHSIAGLVHEFKINLDTQATVLTGELANSKKVEQEFTIQFIRSDGKPLEVGFVIKTIWESFIDVSSKYRRSTNPKVEEYIKTWMGADFFKFDDPPSHFHYPIASVFKGESTQTFYDVIGGLVPQPIYEIFPIMDRKAGKMKIVIRECPFDNEKNDDAWKRLDCTEIDPLLVKSFDITQSDREVYTVFFSYLSGYSVQADKVIKLATQAQKDVQGVEIDNDKFAVYGYRPLFLHFNCYGKADGKDDDGTGDRLIELNKRLRRWYGNLDKMFTGNISMETDLSRDMPQAGEKVSFLGGEFYVVDSEHRWNYGSGPETNISVSRGGDYSGGSWEELKDTAKRYKEFKEVS
jgi:hypothetical protein